MRDYAAAGALLVIALLLVWAGFMGKLGVVLGAIICPQRLVPKGQG